MDEAVLMPDVYTRGTRAKTAGATKTHRAITSKKAGKIAELEEIPQLHVSLGVPWNAHVLRDIFPGTLQTITFHLMWLPSSV